MRDWECHGCHDSKCSCGPAEPSETNRDHRCRTCEHWGSFPANVDDKLAICTAVIPIWAFEKLNISQSYVLSDEGEDCDAYSYSYRRARLVNP